MIAHSHSSKIECPKMEIDWGCEGPEDRTWYHDVNWGYTKRTGFILISSMYACQTFSEDKLWGKNKLPYNIFVNGNKEIQG